MKNTSCPEITGMDVPRRTSFQHGNKVEVMGPTESPLAKIQCRWRQQILLKSENAQALHQLARELMHKMGKSTVRITIDVDPENFM